MHKIQRVLRSLLYKVLWTPEELLFCLMVNFIATRSKQEAERPVLDFQGCKLTLLSSPGPQA